jgi:tetratricopeptide (TPR) repeat protein
MLQNTPTHSLSVNTVRACVCVLAGLFILQAIASMWNDAPTFDEMVSPAAGYAELFTGDLRLVNDHPPLARILMALPLLIFRPALPLEHSSWQQKEKIQKYRYDFAEQFFYVANRTADRMLFWSRIPIVILSLVLGLLVFEWANELYGAGAGLLAFFLYSFEPNIMAHSRLATNDLLVTLLIFSTIYQFWSYHAGPSLKGLLLTGVLLGLALLSKFSAIVLLPILGILALLAPPRSLAGNGSPLFVAVTRGRAIARRVAIALAALFSVVGVAVTLLLIFYGASWKLALAGVHHALVHYRAGQLAIIGHRAFLMGDYSTDGWWYYFLIAFAVKTPVALLIFILVALALVSFRKNEAEYFLLIPVGVLFCVGLGSHLNIGLRHILPVYPFLIVLASSIVTIRVSRPRFFAAGFCGLALWYLLSTLRVFPSYLAYFNEFVGPDRGYLTLVDSNLDWGQDVKRLKKFMMEKGIEQIYLSYFGTASPCYYGIKFIFLPGSPSNCGESPEPRSTHFIAVSATNLQSVYLPVDSYGWLKRYKPMAQIGYSIFVYDIRNDAVAHNNLGIVFLRYQMLAQALEEFKLATELQPRNSTARFNLGVAYAFRSDFVEAEKSFLKALELDPKNRLARKGLEIVHAREAL